MPPRVTFSYVGTERRFERLKYMQNDVTSVERVSSMFPGMAESLTADMTSEVISLKVATPGPCITPKMQALGPSTYLFS
jgi:hypothetical protein